MFPKQLNNGESIGHRILCCLIFIASCHVLSSCSPPPVPDDKIVIAHNLSQIITLDPGVNNNALAGDMIRQLYETLLSIDPVAPSQLNPMLAEAYEVSADQSVYTFRLNKAARFASGRPVTSEDVEFSLERLVLLNRGASSAWLARGFTPENVETLITTDGPAAVRVEVPDPILPDIFLYQFALPTGSIIEKAVVLQHEKDGDLGNGYLTTHSAGSGVFALSSWKPNHVIVLDGVTDHWRQEPNISAIFIQHIAEFSARALMVERGDADIAFDLTPEDLADIESSGRIKVAERLQPRFIYLALNQKHEDLSKPELRQALRYLIDYDGLSESVMGDRGTPRQTYIPTGVFGATDEQPFSLDIDRARTLLTDAGFTDGPSVRLLTLSQSPFVDIAQAIQSRAAEAGLQIEIEQMVGAQLWPIYRSRRHDMVLAAWTSGYPDPHAMTETFVINPDNSDEAQMTGRPAWRTAWQDNELISLAETAASLTDRAEREQAYQELQTQFFQRSPLIPLFQLTEKVAMGPHVEGLVLHTFGIDFDALRKVKE